MPYSSPTVPASLLGATIEHLQRFAPFSRMEREHLVLPAARLNVGYYAKGTVILSPEHGVASRFFIVKQGVVQGEQGGAGTQGGTVRMALNEGECFPVGALLSQRKVASIFRARVDTFCYELPAADFLELIRPPAFRIFAPDASPACWNNPSGQSKPNTANAGAEQQSHEQSAGRHRAAQAGDLRADDAGARGTGRHARLGHRLHGRGRGRAGRSAFSLSTMCLTASLWRKSIWRSRSSGS